MAEHPGLIPGASDTAATCREFPTDSGPVDVVVVGGDGTVTIVETKLASNGEIRREIVAQVLDYAAQLAQLSSADFIARWVSRGASPLPADVVRPLADRLSAGRFRLVLAVDEVHPLLYDIVSFWNERLTLELSLVVAEYRRYLEDDLTFVVPTIYGEPLQRVPDRAAITRAPTKSWTTDELTTWIAEHDPGASAATVEFIAGSRELGARWTGGSGGTPAGHFTLVTSVVPEAAPIYLYTYPVSGVKAELNFIDWTKKLIDEPSAIAAVNELLDELEVIAEIAPYIAKIRQSEWTSRPGVPLRDLSLKSVSETLRALRRFVDHRQ